MVRDANLCAVPRRPLRPSVSGPHRIPGSRSPEEERGHMAAVCELCGKKPSFGMSLSHSHRRTKRRWDPNIQRVRAWSTAPRAGSTSAPRASGPARSPSRPAGCPPPADHRGIGPLSTPRSAKLRLGLVGAGRHGYIRPVRHRLGLAPRSQDVAPVLGRLGARCVLVSVLLVGSLLAVGPLQRPAAAATGGTATWSVDNPIPPRLQWNENNGYCGEMSFISAGLYYGQYLCNTTPGRSPVTTRLSTRRTPSSSWA